MLFYFFIVSVLAEIQANLASKIWHTNLPGLYVYTAIEFIAFSLVFYWHMQNKRGWRLFISINIVVLIGVAVAEAVNTKLNTPNDISRGYASVFLVVYTLRYLYHLFAKDDIRYMWEYPMFWLCAGMLIYFGGNVLYFLTRTYLIDQAAHLEWAYDYFHGVLNIIAYCLYAQSFRCLGKHQTEI